MYDQGKEKKYTKNKKLQVRENKMWMGNRCSAISTKGKGCPRGWKAPRPSFFTQRVALSPSERVCQTDLPFF